MLVVAYRWPCWSIYLNIYLSIYNNYLFLYYMYLYIVLKRKYILYSKSILLFSLFIKFVLCKLWYLFIIFSENPPSLMVTWYKNGLYNSFFHYYVLLVVSKNRLSLGQVVCYPQGMLMYPIQSCFLVSLFFCRETNLKTIITLK